MVHAQAARRQGPERVTAHEARHFDDQAPTDMLLSETVQATLAVMRKTCEEATAGEFTHSHTFLTCLANLHLI